MVGDRLQVFVREDFAIQHIRSAALFARQSNATESLFSVPDAVLDVENKAYACSAIICSVAFLEATINDLFERSLNEPGLLLLDGNSVSRMGVFGRAFANRRLSLPTLESYQLALTCCERPILDRGVQPFQDASLLITLRNALIHFNQGRIATFDSEGPVTVATIVEQFATRFTRNPFSVAINAVVFPNQLLGHGGAQWAVQTALSLADAFFNQLGIVAPYEHIRAELITTR